MREDSKLEHLLKGIFVELKVSLKELSTEHMPIYDLVAGNLHDLGNYKQAVRLLEQIVKIQKTLTKDHPSRVASQHGLASAYLANGQVKQAVVPLEQLVKIEETPPKDHPSRGPSQHDLARAYYVNGQIKQAITSMEQVVEIRKNMLTDHPDRLSS
jgi:tetratricopeptide (TPR) repeat protein